MPPRKVATPGTYNLSAKKKKKGTVKKLGTPMKAGAKKKAKVGRPGSASKRGTVRKGNYRNVVLLL
jgi:hypothetical protein